MSHNRTKHDKPENASITSTHFINSKSVSDQVTDIMHSLDCSVDIGRGEVRNSYMVIECFKDIQNLSPKMSGEDCDRFDRLVDHLSGGLNDSSSLHQLRSYAQNENESGKCSP